MASMRRTLSPATHHHHHHHHNHRVPSTTRPRLPSWPWPWGRPIPCFLFCFLVGFLAGLSHLSNIAAKNSSSSDSFLDPTVVDAATLNSSVVSLHDHEKTPPAAAAMTEKLLLVVTPTYPRALQAYYLRRLAATLRLVQPPLLWIVVEMGAAAGETAGILRDSGVMYRHLACPTPTRGSHAKDRGVHQRNAALDHIERHRLDGVVYFADDDNVYSLDLFHHLRDIRNFGTWPVAMLAQSKSKTIVEGPVCNGSRVIGWHTNEKSKRLRRFHVDMSGFAFNSTMLWDAKKRIHQSWNTIRQLDTVKEGFQETTFIEQLVEDETQMEGIPPGCSRIMNYHLHLGPKNLVYPKGWVISRDLDAVVPLK